MREYEVGVGLNHGVEIGGGIVLYPLNMNVALFAAVSTPAGGAVAQETTVRYSRTTAIKLNTKAVGSAVGDEIKATIQACLRGAAKVCMEYKFRVPTAHSNQYYQMMINCDIAPNAIIMGVRYNGQVGSMEYHEATSGWTACPKGIIDIQIDTWYRVSCIMDLRNAIYEEIVVNGTQCAQGNLYGEVATKALTTAFMEVELKVICGTDDQAVCYFDELLITEAA